MVSKLFRSGTNFLIRSSFLIFALKVKNCPDEFSVLFQVFGTDNID
jgi:hypothetical protein